MEQATQVFAAISFLVIGLSHLAHPKFWVTFYQSLAARGTSGAFLEGFLLLNFGAIIVAFHNVWDGPATVLTVIGWAQVLKGAGRLLAPRIGLRVIERINEERAWYFRIGGITALLLSGFLWWLRFRPWGWDERWLMRSNAHAHEEGHLTPFAAGGGVMVRAEALASLVSTARSYRIRRS